EFRGVGFRGTTNELSMPAMRIRLGYRQWDGIQPSCTIINVTGRLKPGGSAAEAQAEIFTLMEQLRASNSAFDEGRGASVTPAIGVSENRKYIWMQVRLLATTAGILLLIVCANLGGLLVARGTARSGEIAIRLALRAAAGRIVRQIFTESLLLALFCGTAGFLLSTST